MITLTAIGFVIYLILSIINLAENVRDLQDENIYQNSKIKILLDALGKECKEVKSKEYLVKNPFNSTSTMIFMGSERSVFCKISS